MLIFKGIRLREAGWPIYIHRWSFLTRLNRKPVIGAQLEGTWLHGIGLTKADPSAAVNSTKKEMLWSLIFPLKDNIPELCTGETFVLTQSLKNIRKVSQVQLRMAFLQILEIRRILIDAVAVKQPGCGRVITLV